MIDPQHHQPRVKVVRHVLAGLGHGVDADKVAGIAKVGSQALVELDHHFIGVALQLLARSSASLVTVGCVEYQ